MQACLQAMPRCRLSYAKIMQTESITSSLFERFAEVPLILCKDKYKNDNQQVFMQKSFILNEHFS